MCITEENVSFFSKGARVAEALGPAGQKAASVGVVRSFPPKGQTCSIFLPGIT